LLRLRIAIVTSINLIPDINNYNLNYSANLIVNIKNSWKLIKVKTAVLRILFTRCVAQISEQMSV